MPLYTYTYQITVWITNKSTSELEQTVTANHKYPWFYYLLLLIYGLGIFFLLTRYLFGLIKIKGIVDRIGYSVMNNYRLVYTTEFNSSFSVFNYIFMDSSTNLSNTEKELILTHELAHIKQHHWIDLLVVQVFCILQWFNPFIWLYLKYIRQNHEYLADKAVLKQGVSTAVYQAILVNHCIGTRVFSFSSSFNQYSMPRIKMLGKPSSSWVNKLAIAITIPALALFYFTFSVANISFKVQAEKKIVNANLTPKKETAEIVRNTQVAFVKRKSKSIKTPIKIESKPAKVLSISRPLFLIDGVEIQSTFDNIDKNTIAEIHVLKDTLALSAYGDRGRNGVVLITTKKKFD